MKHIPEPWTVVDKIDEPGTAVKIAGPEAWLGIAIAYGDTPEEAWANAERIVACINYCTGMSNEALVKGKS